MKVIFLADVKGKWKGVWNKIYDTRVYFYVHQQYKPTYF